MIERFLKQTTFSDQEDFIRNFHIEVPENFNFAYDVMDVWAEEKPTKTALLWTNDKGECIRFSFADIKRLSDRTASYFQTLGIGKGDMVMVMLKRRYEFWLTMMGLSKIGAVAIPATHLLTGHDIVYRNNRASIKAIICAGEKVILDHVLDAMPESPTVKTLISVGPEVPPEFHDMHAEWENVPEFVRPANVNTNDDIMLMYFTSGTSGNPKMVAHDHMYALGHLATGVYWHNL
ncbi:MAG: AMP-binding protein, partial [Bacteroidales bacterium]|nr:AMP-binding protein [Bacteroidales bacterium]